MTLADSSKAARLKFDNVELDADAVVGDVDNGWRPLSRALNAGRAGAAAELVGIAAGASAMTVDYLKQRKQFGKPIGEFQSLCSIAPRISMGRSRSPEPSRSRPLNSSIQGMKRPI